MRLEIRDAAKSFAAFTVFQDLNAVFEWGGVTAVVGPSGSGKSTLLSVLAGFQVLDRGSVLLVDADGESVKPNPDLVAWVPQGANALPGRTALDNVMIAPLAGGFSVAVARDCAMTALAAVSMADKQAERASHLSGGELQRVAIARAIASGRPMIFADEPTANLDQANTVRVGEAIATPRTDQMVIIATHDPYLMSLAQSIVNLRSPSPSSHNAA